MLGWIRKAVLIGILAVIPLFSAAQNVRGFSPPAADVITGAPGRSLIAPQQGGGVGPCVPPAGIDLLRDGIVNLQDGLRVVSRWPLTSGDPDPDSDPSTPNYESRFDIDGSGVIDVVDIVSVLKEMGRRCSLGMQMFDEDLTDQQVLDSAGAGGVGFLRIYASWGSLEPSRDNYKWAGHDNLLATLRDEGYVPMVTVTNNPSWAASTACGPHDGLPDYGEIAEFMGDAVERYDGDGYMDAPGSPQAHYWELYNEEDQISQVNNAGGCWGDDWADYAQMMAAVWDAVHAANSEASVTFGGVALENFDEYNFVNTTDNFLSDALGYMQSNPDDYVDRVSFHQYDFRRMDWDGTPPQDQGVLGKAAAVKVLLDQNGLGDTGLSVSEIGLQIDTGAVSDKEERQARHVVREMTRALAGGMHPIIWYTFVDGSGGSGFRYGLLDDSLNPRPSYIAFQVMAQQLKDAQPDGQVVFSDSEVTSGNPNYVQAFRFVKASGTRKLVLFIDNGAKAKDASADDDEADVVVDASTMDVSGSEWTGELARTDKEGSTTTLGAPGNANVTVHVTHDPIYLEIVP